MTLEQDLVAIERGLWTNDAEVYYDSLIPEAVLVFVETGPIGRDFAVEAIREERRTGRRWASAEFAAVTVTTFDDATALLVYEVTARWENEAEPYYALCSSLYLRRDGAWKLGFHQQSSRDRAKG